MMWPGGRCHTEATGFRQLRLLTPQGGQHPGEDQDQAVPAGVHHAGLGEDVKLLWGPLDCLLAIRDRLLEHCRKDCILGTGSNPGL